MIAEKATAEEDELAQKTADTSESDSNYESVEILSDKSFLTIQEISDNTISDISDLNIIIDEDDIETNKISSLKQQRNPPTKTTKPKSSWVWKFFEFNEDNTKTICQI